MSSHASCLPKALCFCFPLLPWYVSELSLSVLSSSSLACHLQDIFLDLVTYSEQMCVNTVWKKPTQPFHFTIKQCGKCSIARRRNWWSFVMYIYLLIILVLYYCRLSIASWNYLFLSAVPTENDFFKEVCNGKPCCSLWMWWYYTLSNISISTATFKLMEVMIENKGLMWFQWF